MRRILNIVAKNLPLIAILIAGIFLRFYRFPQFVTFLGDQGRDAIIIKRILTLEHFPAIGAPMSVGQIYLGPFYYYFIALWLLLFKFNPIGLACAVGFFSCLYLFINYLIVNELFNKKVALISTFLIAFSYPLIDLSRYSWNPNLMPFASLLTVYFFIKSLSTKKTLYYLLFGAFLSFSIQLHYLALFLLPTIIIFVFWEFFKIRKTKKLIKPFIINYLSSFIAFGFFSLPLLVFDLRHNFQNTRSLINLFSKSSPALGNKTIGLWQTFSSLNQYSFGFNFNIYLSSLILISLFLALIVLIVKKEKVLKIFMSFLIVFVVCLAFYNGEKPPHYFGVAYPLYYIVIAYFLDDLSGIKLGRYLLVAFLAAFIILNAKNYVFLYSSGSNQIIKSQAIARVIYDNVTNKIFTVTAQPEKYSDSTYRYFLEIWGKRSLEKDSLEKANELFIVCDRACQLIGNPQWEIAYFAPTKIVGQWKVDDVKIYKLIR